MRVYKDLDYIKEHLQEIVDETTVAELEMEPNYEYTDYWFFVKTENGGTVKIMCHLYIKWSDHWFIDKVSNGTI